MSYKFILTNFKKLKKDLLLDYFLAYKIDAYTHKEDFIY
jgi:hypothetical protein